MKNNGYNLTRLDISPTDGLDLDERDALEYFFGKNQEEAAELLHQNFTHYIDYLAYMGDRAFYYYLGSVKLYIKKNVNDFLPSDYVELGQELLPICQFKEKTSQSCTPKLNEDFQWIASFIINNLCKILQDDESWVLDSMLISDRKIGNLIKRWKEYSETP